MHSPEEKLIDILKDAGVTIACTLPCDRIKTLIALLADTYGHSSLHYIPLTREEEGVGICAGAALAGKRSAMFFQNSGLGNMINALLSLTGFYKLPLALFISHRGVYKEKIAAQAPMGDKLPGLLRGAGIRFTNINAVEDFSLIGEKLRRIYRNSEIHAFLLSPAVWEGSPADAGLPALLTPRGNVTHCTASSGPRPVLRPRLTRFGILETISPFLEGKAVVCNLGVPAKELFSIKHRTSHFYMLGSMGMVTPLGLGISLTTDKDVVVIDGDGSILMNPGSLATVAALSPRNLTIVAIDNGAYGSTGNQPTYASTCVDLELVARGFGIRETLRVATKEQLRAALKASTKGPRFIHVLALPGNANVPNIPLDRLEIKKQMQDFLKDG
jgi:sulfopyruvate decarboxylase subunit beta